ncbi:Molybdopterin or thiamine biosynthesis adenylyltransferase [Amycolatopsis lurida]|uniref:Dinucleotide-utilizing protein n=1 Tax=Amycolatopsis lurida NRRL 2430 TaxID=1460371 RepID=A0A2P2FFD8_AMYLU|nr:ThiF family adenylyltransferase [Amycolatopsis lurida]KFU75433.1 dinucleotide-utilizing protein [Amycolatopsis lurida NRRL 2430]SEC85208.1 Molybdopterin or thiamine biosynthesis adenylyltransferase [Amycolatopsis lurida]
MWRPRIKFAHRPVRYDNGQVRIGGNTPGITRGLRDPDGLVWALLALLDGSRTVGQIADELIRRFPACTSGDVRQALDNLNTAGYLEDASEIELSESERERYSRSCAFWRAVDRTPGRRSWDAQLRLRQARVVIVGVGGAGGTAARLLVMSGVGQLHCVDADMVELSNLNRQGLFTEQDLGRPKVEVALTQLRKHNSHVDVTGSREHIKGPDQLRALAVACDVLLMAADQPSTGEIRSWTNQACHSTRTAWVHSGYDGPRVSVGVFRPGSGPCYDCARAAEQHRRSVVSPRTAWAPGKSMTREHAAIAASAALAGDLAAYAIERLITEAPDLPVNQEYGLNLATLRDYGTLRLERPWPDCPTCAHDNHG